MSPWHRLMKIGAEFEPVVWHCHLNWKLIANSGVWSWHNLKVCVCVSFTLWVIFVELTLCDLVHSPPPPPFPPSAQCPFDPRFCHFYKKFCIDDRCYSARRLISLQHFKSVLLTTAPLFVLFCIFCVKYVRRFTVERYRYRISIKFRIGDVRRNLLVSFSLLNSSALVLTPTLCDRFSATRFSKLPTVQNLWSVT